MSTDPILRESKKINVMFLNINLLTPDIRKQKMALSNSSIDDLEEVNKGDNPGKIEMTRTSMNTRHLRNSKNVTLSRKGSAIENSHKINSDETIIDMNHGLDSKEDIRGLQEDLHNVSNVKRSISQMLIEKNVCREEACVTEVYQAVNKRFSSGRNSVINFNIILKIKSKWNKIKRRKNYRKFKQVFCKK
ncbi:hypothetical protein TNCT_686201 [Trichonephila clavata]|uniref:Uncharacterized protein n=1 Tax=Trichonephila clavata TaxID=2740835 RepID=A0A8X6GFE0_TRICU|nr:hypothetical protein TNCT_686201 [Trichonephila clavata]